MTMNELKMSQTRPVEELKDDMAAVSESIKSGRAFLKVVAYPWDVEFDVCDIEEGSR